MAQLTLAQVRGFIRTSRYGSRLGLDTTVDQINAVGGSVMRGGMLCGFPGIRMPIQKIISTGGSSIYPSGYVELSATTASSAINSIQAPIPGVEVMLAMTATSTLGHVIQSSGAAFLTSLGSSQNQITLTGQGAFVRLLGLSTALFAVTGQGSTGNMAFTTF